MTQTPSQQNRADTARLYILEVSVAYKDTGRALDCYFFTAEPFIPKRYSSEVV